jgi:membrane-associated phospholipid phosphatase
MIATGGPDKYSFPSGHASRAIMTTMLLINFINLSFIYSFSLIVWSYFTCLSRLLLARHHVFDVFIGIILGYSFYFLIKILYI